MKLLHFKYVFVFAFAALLFTGCTEDETALDTEATRSSNTVRPYGLITPERMVELNSNWYKTRVPVIESKLGFEDNHSVRFPIEELENYLKYAKNEAKELGYELDGVRIYFAAYSTDEPGDKAGMSTVFIAPTGYETKHSESMFFSMRTQSIGGDIPGGSGLNYGQSGPPPPPAYPN